ncbi:uncharacterized protein B0P05DRAFT_466450 [Gilbertella persicaria]|uniref:uncharacterized protein n=1 Tax=Gilbertella persicaria TaxID=101096 RepID=UPI00221F725E|nr:uncharacterized protein B0P05DRAFT_466450 [Gilbertella persicaria]KAI8085829.1 hypothetical protein B0P05DRAFT_466450 [Gilbertella persicaria]
MKLSYCILLLAAFAGLQVSAAPGSTKCVSGSAGLGNGDGYKGYCCNDSDDCKDACVKGVCVGPSAPTKTTTTSGSKPTSGTCISGSTGLGKGDGYKGYCCDNSDDCQDTCIKGVCNGPSAPSKTTTTTATKTATKTTTTSGTQPTSTCAPGSYGLSNGDGQGGDCCKTNDDCKNACIKGVCNGPKPSGTPEPCKKGYAGLAEGNGPLNACCETSDDCQEACVRGRCTAP